MINITDKHKCCGCSACIQKCPKKCITMLQDEEGFYYPNVDVSQCINCGLCEKVCPFLNSKEAQKPITVYAAKNKDEVKRDQSSSGGVFIVLAETIIEKGGVVFGAALTDSLDVQHIYVDKIEDLHLLMGSKYVQSDINTTYVQCRTFLEENRYVLYSGTSCQIMGLNLFLKKKYDKLLTVDVICHGVPSPGIWKKYIDNELKKFSLLPKDIKIQFRDKNTGWENFSFSIYNRQHSTPLKTQVFYRNIYINGFLANIIIRPSCYNCPAKNGKAQSDITLADFWGVNNVYPNLYERKGTSLVLTHTDKGNDFIKCNDLELGVVDFEKAIAHNPSYKESVKEPDKRKQFFTLYKKKADTPVEDLLSKILHVSLTKRIINKLKRII